MSRTSAQGCFHVCLHLMECERMRTLSNPNLWHRSVNLQNREISRVTLISVTTCQRPSRSIVTLLRMIPLVCKFSSCITTHFHSSASLLPHCRRCQYQPCFVSVFAILCVQRQALDVRRDLNVGQAFGKHDLLCATSCPTAVLQSSWRPLPFGDRPPTSRGTSCSKYPASHGELVICFVVPS